MNVLHSCDNPSCVRPSHLRIGTQHENIMEMAARGRGIKSAAALPVGVSRHRTRWQASVTVNCRTKHFGMYKTIEEASEVVQRERERIFGVYAAKDSRR